MNSEAMTPDQVKQARKTLRLNQAQMAQMLGYGAQARVSDVERGAHPLDRGKERLLQAYLSGYRPPDWPSHS